jgi:26S proteasome regulatory subunit N2
MLLDDTHPDEEKTLIEEKLKKVTTERAPVAGQSTRSGGRSGGRSRNTLEGLVDPVIGSEMMDHLLRGEGRGGLGLGGLGGAAPQTPDVSGAAAAAGVLTAVDEDGEGDEEAPVPNEFEYFSNDEDME